MRHIAAYLLLQIGGKAEPTADDISKLLSTVGITADEERAEKLISELQGKDVAQVSVVVRTGGMIDQQLDTQLIAEGSSKLSSVGDL